MQPEQSEPPSLPRETQPLHDPPPDDAPPDHGDGVVYDAVRVEYRDMASWYDCFWKSYTAATLRRPLGMVCEEMERRSRNRPADGVCVVDVGCGTGEFLRRLLDAARPDLATGGEDECRLVGVEPSREMLDQAHQKFDGGAGGGVELRQAPAEHLPLPDASVDVIVTTNAFHFFRSKQQSLAEMSRVLKRDGVLIITDWCANYWLVQVYHLLERIRWNWRFEERYPSPLTNTELKGLVREAGFEVMDSSRYRTRVFGIFWWGMQTVIARKSGDE